MKRAGWLLFALLAAGSSCGGEKPAPGQNTAPRGIVRPEIANQNNGSQPAPANQPSTPPATAPTALPRPAANPAPTATSEDETEPTAEKKRDYADELQRAVGAPIDCLKPREGADSPAEIKVELEAFFLETGATSRAYARSAALGPDELACIQKRLETVRLASPIEQAPRAVQTTLTFKLRTPDNPTN